MAATNYTPISIYYSTTAAATPSAGNLVNGELAINIQDGKLFYKDAAGVVQVIAGKGGAGVAGGSNTQVQYNSSGSLAGSANMTFNGTTLTLANDASISGLTVGRGAGAVASNTAVGFAALPANTTGTSNIAIGQYALLSNTTGSSNIGVGWTSLQYNNGTGNSAVGYNAMQQNTLGLSNSAFGFLSLSSNTTANYNSGLGAYSLTSNTTGVNNTAVGYQSLNSNTTASNNTAVGYQAAYANTTGYELTAIGYRALYSNTTGIVNTAIGTNSLSLNTTGQTNAAVGHSALLVNTTGSSNTALGYQSLVSNTTANYNTAVGYQAGYTNQTGSLNTFIGRNAGYTSNYNGNAANTCVGHNAGYSLTTGVYNTFIGGTDSGYYVTTGQKNAILGHFNGNQGGLDIRTANNIIVLSDGDGNPRVYWDSTGVMTQNASVSDWSIQNNNKLSSGAVYGLLCNFTGQTPNNSTSNFIGCTDTTSYKFRVYSNGGIANYSANNVNLSDETLKKDIQLAPNYLDKLCQIPVKTYLYKEQTDADLNLGVIAQEVQAVCPELVGTMDIGKDASDVKLAIYETDFKYAMLKAIQELKAEVDSLKQQLGK